MHYKLIRDLDSDHIDHQDRAFHYGDGLFETMLLTGGQINYWPEHYTRLRNSAERLSIQCPDKNWFEENLLPYIDLNQNLIIKIILSRGSGGRGLSLPDELDSNIYIFKYPKASNSNSKLIKAVFSEITLPRNNNLSGLKHLNRLDYILATLELKKRPGFNEAVLSDTDGQVIEGIINNLFFVKNNTICTPDLKTSGVNGIMRQLILKKLKQLKKDVKIDLFNRQDVISADECFLCNSVLGIQPIILIEDSQFKIGPITQYLQTKFHGNTGI